MLGSRARSRLVETLERDYGIQCPKVLGAIAAVARDEFVDEALQGRAYDDCALPIGHGQTISHPATVARMTEVLELSGDEKVLEIGTGSGYQAAVLSHLCANVYSIERISALATRARRIIEGSGIYNVAIRVGDGSIGWRAEAPFDAAIVTAGSPQVPRPILDQLKTGGRLVVPVGESGSQSLVRYVVEPNGIRQEVIGDCRFVPLRGRYGFAQ